MPVHPSIRKLFSAIRLYKFGIFPLFINRFLSGIFSYQNIIFYDVDLKEEASLSPPEVPGLSVKKICNAGDDLFRKLLHDYPCHAFEDRIGQSTKDCYAALYDRELVGYAWITYEKFFVDELNYTYPLRDDEFFIYDCFVSPEYRGRGIYPAMLQTILWDYSMMEEYRRACIGVSFTNKGSRRGVTKAGFREYNRISYRRWFGREKWQGIERRKEAEKIAKRAVEAG